MRSRPASRQDTERDAKACEDEREFADLRAARRDHQRGRFRIAEQPHDRIGDRGLADE